MPGIRIHVDGGVSGNFRVLCDGQHDEGVEEEEEEEVVVAILDPQTPFILPGTDDRRRSCRARTRPAPAPPRATAIIAVRRSIVGQRIPCRAPVRSTAPGIASSSGVRPAAISLCIELPRPACAL